MPLADKALRPGPRTRKVADGGGLFLRVNLDGSTWWRFKYRCDRRLMMQQWSDYLGEQRHTKPNA